MLVNRTDNSFNNLNIITIVGRYSTNAEIK